MRTIIIVIYLILYYIFSIPAWFVGWIIGKINPDMKPRYAQTLIRRAFKDILFIAGVKVTVKGQENVLQVSRQCMSSITGVISIFWWVIQPDQCQWRLCPRMILRMFR